MSRVNIWYTRIVKNLDDKKQRDDSMCVNLDSSESDIISSEIPSFGESEPIDIDNSFNVAEISFRNEDFLEHLSNPNSPETKEMSEDSYFIKLAQRANLIRKINEQKKDSPEVFAESRKDEELCSENPQLSEQIVRDKAANTSDRHISKFFPSYIKYLNRKVEPIDSGDDWKMFKKSSLMFAPIFQEQIELNKLNKIERYTVDQEFYDHWTNKRKMDDDKLKNILRLWASDNWEGLYDPPNWLTAGMFLMALTDEPSNKRKVEKLVEATEYLEMAKRTNSKLSAYVHEKGAIKDTSSTRSNEPFKESVKSIGLMMRSLSRKTKDLDRRTKSFKLKNECMLTIDRAVHDFKDEIDRFKEGTRSF